MVGLFGTCVRTDDLPPFLDESRVPLLNLSAGTKLRDAFFRPTSLDIRWITMALQTITPEHRALSQVSIYVSDDVASVVINADVKKTLGEANFGQWLDLDRLLVQLWESRSVRPKVIREAVVEGGPSTMRDCIGSLLPEMTKGGMDHHSGHEHDGRGDSQPVYERPAAQTNRRVPDPVPLTLG